MQLCPNGTVPAEWASLERLKRCELRGNRLSGMFSKEIVDKPIFKKAYLGNIEEQQAGYGFTFPATVKMIQIADDLYLHPDDYALEYRMKNFAIPTVEDMQKVLCKAYKSLSDEYDFVYFICSAQYMPGSTAGYSNMVKSDILGLQHQPMDNSAAFGSAGHLKNTIVVTNRRENSHQYTLYQGS